MDIRTVAGRIRLDGGVLRCESPRTFSSSFMMFGMVVVALGIPVMAVSSPEPGIVCSALVLGPAWLALVWYWAGGRFGTFVVDPERRELLAGDGRVIAPLDQVRFSTVLDLTDGTRFWTGENRWLTASCPGFTRTYRLGKMSADDAARVLAQLRAWGCRA